MQVGDKFNSWTIIDLTPVRDKYNNIKLKCQCDCGKISYIYKSKLKNNTKSCKSCVKVKCNIPKIGEIIGNWTIISNIPNKTKYGNRFKAKCKCGHEASILYIRVLNNPTKSCEKCRLIGKFKSTDKEILSCRLYANYKSSAKKRNLNLELTKEEIYNLCVQNCYYCGSKHSNSYTTRRKESYIFTYNGIDRIDNCKGYTLENSVTCCKTCNFAKHNLTTEHFLQWIKQLVLHNRSQ